MEKLTLPSQNVLDIDANKRVLEAKYIPKFRKIFNNIANDTSTLLNRSLNINSKEIADNYKPDVIALLRQLYRDTIKKFGFRTRKEVEKKFNINFNILLEMKKFEIKQDDIINDFILEEEQESDLNSEFFALSTLFINNQSEKQSELITNTTQKQIDTILFSSITAYNLSLSKNITTQQELQQEITSLRISIFGGDSKEKQKKLKKLENELDKLKNKEKSMIKNKNKIVANEFNSGFKDRSKSRSETISEFEVGQTESYTRNMEGELLNGLVVVDAIVSVKKNWVSMGDSKVRESHQIADATYNFEPIPVNQDFIVGGERLKRARDSNGSASNIIGCRCVNQYSVS